MAIERKLMMESPRMRRFGIIILSGLIFSGALSATAPAAESEPSEEVKKVTYEDDVRPIFRQHCFTCHNQNEKKGGLALDTYASTIEGGASGEVVYEGDGGSSRLWMLIAHEDTPVMPPGQDMIDAKKVDIVKQWIDLGLLENQGSKVKKKKTNRLAFSASSDGKPEGPAAMPETVWKQPVVVTPRPGAVTAIACSPWAPLVAIGGQSQVVLYNTETGQLAGILPFPEGEPQSLNFSRDGSYLLVGGGQHSFMGFTALYDVKTGDRVAKVGDELDIVFGSDVNETLTRVAMGGPKRLVHVHDLNTGELVYELKKHTDWVYDVEFSPDGVLIASGDRSGGLVLWEAPTGRFYMDLPGHKDAVRDIAWRADSNIVASASLDGTVKLWEVFNGKQVKSFNAHGGGVTSIDMARDGKIVTSGKDRRVKLWDANGQALEEFPPMAEAVLEVAFTHDGSHVVAGDWTGNVKMWKADDPKQEVVLDVNPPKLETRLAKSREALQAAEQNLTAAKQDFAAKNDKLQQLSAQLASYQEQLPAAEEALNKAKAELQAASEQAKQAAEKLVEVTQQRDTLLTKVGQQQPQLEAASKQLHQLSNTLAKKQKALGAAVAARDAAAVALASVDDQIGTAQGSDRETLLANRKSAAETLTAKASELKPLTGEVQSLQRQLGDALEKLRQQQQSFDALQQELSETQQRLSEKRLEKLNADQRLKTAEAGEQAAAQALATLQQNITDARKTIETLQPQVQQAQQQVTTAQSAFDAATTRVDSLTADLKAFQRAPQQLAKAEASAEQQLDELAKQIERAQQAASQIGGQLDSESTQLAELKKQMEQLQAKVNALRSEKRKHETVTEEASAQAEAIEFEREKVSTRRALYEAAYGGAE
jgi:WD40 repeat protein/mono/diheme cytochrome c family protein